MSDTQISDQMDGESILYDAMDSICKYLSVKDLSNLSKVCKSWRHAAQRETAKRCYIQQLRLPYDFNNWSESATPDVASMLIVKPHASLLIYSDRLNKLQMLTDQGIKYPVDKMLKDFKKQLPNKMVALAVNEYLTTEDVEFEGTKDQCELELTGNCGLLGLFIPSVKQRARVHVAWTCSCKGSFMEIADRLIEKLGFENCDRPKSTVLLFAHGLAGYIIADAFVHNLCKRFEDGKDTIWIADFGNYLVEGNSHRESSQRTERSIVALRIAGPNVESWSTVIDCYWQPEEIERELHAMKEKVIPRTYCTGLLYAPRYVGGTLRKNGTDSSQEILRTMKRIFPSVPFVGLFNNAHTVMSAYESAYSEDGARLRHSGVSISIIIISYD